MARRDEAPSDRWLGIRAQRPVDVADLPFEHPNKIFARPYQATPAGVLADLLLDVHADEPRTSFVDLGAGKGRVVCLAAGRPYREVIGVELAPSLCAEARRHVEALPTSWRRAARVRVVQADAASLDWPDTPLVVFLFNPFAWPVLRRVLDRLERSLDARPRPTWIVYHEAVEAAELEQRPRFRSVRRTDRDWVLAAHTELEAGGG